MKKRFSKILRQAVPGHPDLAVGVRVESDPEAEGVFMDRETCESLEAGGFFKRPRKAKKPKGGTL